MTPFECSRCHAPVFFENTQCTACGAWLAFHPGLRRMLAYTESPAGPNTPQRWRRSAEDAPPADELPCANRLAHGVCNWMVDDEASGATLCRSCRLTRTRPDLAVAGNAERWARIEQAKRRLLFTLDGLGLRLQPRSGPGADPQRGVAFDFLARVADGPPVRTGHDDGVITLDIAEADDGHREQLREQLGEPLRTLLGHLRHETAHYLQFRWIDPHPERHTRWQDSFGNDGLDYPQALQQHYEAGPPADWPERFISAYASAHPYEDWAETCAHWLLIVDAVQTAAAWGLRLDGPAPAQPPAAQPAELPPADTLVLQHWLPVVQFLNAMNRSVGLRDSYPFLLPPPVVAKLQAAQRLLAGAAADAARNAPV